MAATDTNSLLAATTCYRSSSTASTSTLLKLGLLALISASLTGCVSGGSRVLVNGAGVAAANGVYTWDGTTNPQGWYNYTNASGSTLVVPITGPYGGQWLITASGTAVYHALNAVQFPDQSNPFTVANTGGVPQNQYLPAPLVVCLP